MPKISNRILESRRYFLENVVLKAFEDNRKLPPRLRRKSTQIVNELSFTYAHCEQTIWVWLRQHQKNKQTEIFK